jgi:hypothetical protein
MSYAPRLVIMAKEPRAGAVKTRLARDIGAAPAAFVYRHLLARTLRALARDRRWRTVIAFTPSGAVPRFAGIAAMAQGGGDLGARMDRIMRTLPPGPVVIVGTDIWRISATDIARAFAALGSADAVFGPAADGGYWLVGLRRRPRVRSIFARVRWSSDHALADTLENCAGLHVAMLDERADIDTGDDYRAFLAAGGLRL